MLSNGKRSTYAPALGREHCPACWVRTGSTSTLRTEPHHNADRVWFVVCDACGFYLVL
jgi:hypothetical protein